MAKNTKHQKTLKSERAKVKLKSKKKANVLPKGQNITDTSFKVKKILIRGQLKQHDESEILSRRQLNVKDLLSRLQHHNSTVRQDAIRELKDILLQHPIEILSAHLNSLLQGISSLTLDKERDIRRDALKVLALILGPISNEQLAPFSDILISYLSCAMTHIVPNIKEDSLNFLDVLVQNCSNLIARNARKILPKFLDLISKHQAQSQTRQLVVTLNSRNTSNKWRTKVLHRLCSILSSIISEIKSHKLGSSNAKQNEVVVDEQTFHVPLYHSNDLCRIAFDRGNSVLKETEEVEEFNKYIAILMPLMFESWLEVRPKKIAASSEVPALSNEASNFLTIIASVMNLIVEYIELMEPSNGPTGDSFRQSFQTSFCTYLLSDFPYSQLKSMERPAKRRQSDFEDAKVSDNCLEQNFTLCYVYMWMISSLKNGKIADGTSKEFCERILEFINERLSNWTNSDVSAIPHLIKLLRVVFIKCSKIMYKSRVNLGPTLHATIAACNRLPKRELQTQLFNVLTEIVLDNNLTELHKEPAFLEFIKGLPDLLLKPSIHENVIQVLNRVVLQCTDSIRRDLAQKQDAILDNAKEIQIIGCTDEKRSRLMICNLFHFMDGQVYF